MDIDQKAFTGLAETYLDRWHCHADGDIFFTHSSLLWPVKRGDTALMMKIVKPDDDEAHAAEILEFFDGNGAVRLIEKDGTVQLLERITTDDGTSDLEALVLRGDDDAATEIICDVIAALHDGTGGKTPPQCLIPFRSRSDEMRKHMAEGRVPAADLPFFEAAAALCETLIAATKDTEMPLHGDIHHFNIMKSNMRGWLAIDPKGILGPRVYEYANALCNPCPRQEIAADRARMSRQADIIAERAGLDKNLLLHFTFFHAMQCAAWSLFEPDKSYWFACAKTAAQLAGIPLPP
ncbi:MAG: hypothetical protein EP349_03140 [Alphaproteobacteria bacterium]|nr:MAG: hypothetical protein EP349_03140 [Alphaproteobacteria bacterium]